jgi:hypothetical protein
MESVSAERFSKKCLHQKKKKRREGGKERRYGVQVVEHLLCKCTALSLNPIPPRKRKKELLALNERLK